MRKKFFDFRPIFSNKPPATDWTNIQAFSSNVNLSCLGKLFVLHTPYGLWLVSILHKFAFAESSSSLEEVLVGSFFNFSGMAKENRKFCDLSISCILSVHDINGNRASWMSKLLNFQILKISNFPRVVFLFCNLFIDYATAVWFRQPWTILQTAPSVLSILPLASFYPYILSDGDSTKARSLDKNQWLVLFLRFQIRFSS